MVNRKIKVLSVFGTRPEGIKMAPVVKALSNDPDFIHKTCITAQHRHMLDQVLNIFQILPEYDLDIFEPGQSLSQITMRALAGIEKVILDYKPDVLLVQGDTTTVFAGALAGYYHQVKVGHVEAGLRSGNLFSPYPEEGNRKMTGVITHYHFAPTIRAKEHLIQENYNKDQIYVTGNTVIDALMTVVNPHYRFEDPSFDKWLRKNKTILLTAHRRENIGKPMEEIFSAIRQIVHDHEDVQVVYPMHLNPKVRTIANGILGNHDRIKLVEPMEYVMFANLINRCELVITDSGGIQEEAPSLGKPVLVAREETERPEGIEAGTARLVGTNQKAIYDTLNQLLLDESHYLSMAQSVNPYGDGKAAIKIKEIIKNDFKSLKK